MSANDQLRLIGASDDLGPITCIADPYYDIPDGDPAWRNVVLQMHFNGADGGATFTDSSTFARAFSVLSNIPILSSTQAKFGPTAGKFFNSSAISTPHSPELSFGDRPFTIEFWIYRVSTPAFLSRILYRTTPGFYEYDVRLNTSGSVVMIGTNGATQFFGVSSPTPVPLNTWTHVAISADGVLDGTSARMYYDGVLVATGGGNGTFNAAAGGELQIGNNAGVEGLTEGWYLDDLRITKGLSRYTSNFKIPAATYPDAVQEDWDLFYLKTVLLVHFGQGNGTNLIVDSSYRSRYIIPAIGNGAITTTSDSKWGTGCGSFDGSGDFWEFNSSNADWNFRTHDFTVECWVKSTQTGTRHLVGDFIDNFTGTWALRMIGGVLVWHIRGSTIAGDPADQWQLLTGTITINDGQWHHVAGCRANGSMRIFVDGVLDGSIANTYDYNANITARVSLGRPALNATQDFQGLLDDVRITWAGRYPRAFTPPAREFANNAFQLTSLMLHGESVADSSNYPKSFTNNNVVASADQSVFGGKSLYFNGTNAFLSIPTNRELQLFYGDFTIELWLRISSTATQGSAVISTLYPGSGFVGFTICFASALGGTVGNTLCFGWYGGSWSGLVTAFTPTLNTWHHIAVTRKSGVLAVFADGVRIALGWAAALPITYQNIYVGRRWDIAGVTYFPGYVDDLRITAGAARYSSTFEVPTAEHPDSAPDDPDFANVLLLLHFNGPDGSTTFTDSSSYSRTLTISNGSPTISTAQSKFGGASLFGGNTDACYINTSQAGAEWATTTWTWECWYRRETDSNYHGFFTCNNTNLSVLLRGQNNSGKWQLFVTNSGFGHASSTSSVPIGVWTHLAIVNSPQTGMALFVNGVLETVAGAVPLLSVGANFTIGRTDSGGFSGLRGYVDDYRITKAAKYSRNFTPPALTFCDSVSAGYVPPDTNQADSLTGMYLELSQGLFPSVSQSGNLPIYELQGRALTLSGPSTLATAASPVASVGLVGRSLSLSGPTSLAVIAMPVISLLSFAINEEPTAGGVLSYAFLGNGEIRRLEDDSVRGYWCSIDPDENALPWFEILVNPIIGGVSAAPLALLSFQSMAAGPVVVFTSISYTVPCIINVRPGPSHPDYDPASYGVVSNINAAFSLGGGA